MQKFCAVLILPDSNERNTDLKINVSESPTIVANNFITPTTKNGFRYKAAIVSTTGSPSTLKNDQGA